ncbi:MAG: hypothetical protein JWQ70_2164 [Aeromicrobium sp.]|nr:hypothetical protein [Aeromicrobium sp.]
MRRAAVLRITVALALSAGVLAACGGPTTAPAPKSSIKALVSGQPFTLSGHIGDKKARAVKLQNRTNGAWATEQTDTTKANGAYSFSLSSKEKSSRYRVIAPKSSGSALITSKPIKIKTHEDKISLGVYRIGDEGRASGKASPTIEGRSFQLQYRHEDKWEKLGAPIEENSEGTVTTDFPMSGTKSYRFVGAALKGAPAVYSPTESFAKGPAKLSKNVIYITTDDRKDPEIKGKAQKGKALIVADGQATRPLDVAEFADRGNSSADKIKKPYKLKFDHKQSPFGFPKDKSWILLANYGDRTLVRSGVAWDVNSVLDNLKWTPRNEFAELYLNGRYEGSYQLVESIKVNKHRINISKKNGVVIEIDPHFKKDGVPGFFGAHLIPYAFKVPDERRKNADGTEDLEEVTDAKVAGMKKRILDFEKVLYGPNFKDPKTGWTKYLDLDSAVDYYLLKEFVKENDGDFYRSNFFYTDDYRDPKAKFFMGPGWDFDRSAGAKPFNAVSGTTIAEPTGWWLRGHGSPNHSTDKTHWYIQITKDPVFLEALSARWLQVRDKLKTIAYHDPELLAAELGPAAADDRARWTSNSQRYEPHASTYPGEIDYLTNWYIARYKWIDSQLGK